LAYFEVENANSNAFINTYKQGQLTTSRNYFPAIGRSEFEANIFKVFQMYDRFELALGGGIRNINKYIYGKNNLNGAYQEYYFTYGPQISFQSSWNFYKTFYLQLHGDLFYTRGTRFSDNLVIRPDLIRKSINNSSWNLIYRGYEIDFSLKHKINDELSIYLGYNFIESFYSPYKNNSLNLDWSLNDQNISSIEINQNLLKGNFETLKGVYLAFKINL
jgi:outer membrane protein (TIGR04327 family)